MIDIWWLERIEEESLCVVGFNLCHDLYIAHTSLCSQFLDTENNGRIIDCLWVYRFVLQQHGAVWKCYQFHFMSKNHMTAAVK